MDRPLCVLALALPWLGVCLSGQDEAAGAAAQRAERAVKRMELPAERERAVWELLLVGEPALPALRRALHDPRPDVVRAAAYALGLFGARAAGARGRLRELRDAAAGVQRARFASALDAVSGRRAHLLLAEFGAGALLRLDGAGGATRVLRADDLRSARWLGTGSYLLADADGVREQTAAGETCWSFDAPRATSATRLANGRTLFADPANARVVEVTAAGAVAWSYVGGEGFRPVHARRLDDGRTLICDYRLDDDGGVLVVDRDGGLVWRRAWRQAAAAQRLPDGRTVIVSHQPGAVSVVDAAGRVLRRVTPMAVPSCAELLPNEHLLVGGEGAVGEFDGRGEVVWQLEVRWVVSMQRL